jgi:hypothetical protein
MAWRRRLAGRVASRRREDKVFGLDRDHLRSEGFLCWPMTLGGILGATHADVGLASVLSNCESGSGASLGAPFGRKSARVGACRLSSHCVG